MSILDCRTAWNIAKTLHKKSSREESRLFLIEGHREIELAVKSGIEIIYTFDKSNTSAKNMERISYCGEVIALAGIPEKDLSMLKLPETLPPLIIVLDNIEKPGNIGAIIRTADAAGVTAVLVCGRGRDLTNPNLIRASLGAVFSIPVYGVSDDEAYLFLSRHKIPVVTAAPDASKAYYEYDFTGPAALVAGEEASGISDFWAGVAEDTISIPMTGTVNSLNVSVSAGIIIYEAMKSRNYKKRHL